MIQTNANSFAIEYVYYHPIEVVWEELKDICKWNNKQNYFSKFQFINGTNTWEIGSQYQFEYKETIPVVYETKKFYEDDFSKSIGYECIENKLNGVMFYSEYNLYKNTLQNSTVLTYNLQYFIEIGYVILNSIKFDKLKLLSLNDKYLYKNRKFETEHIETCIFKKSKSFVWNLITDFKIFTKIITGIADEVILKDDILKLNSKLIMKYNKENLEIPLKVNKYQNEEKLEKWTLCFRAVITNDNKKNPEKEFYIPFQEISFEILDIECNTKNKSMLIFKHNFKDKEVANDNLSILEFNKRMILKRIKKYCSKK